MVKIHFDRIEEQLLILEGIKGTKGKIVENTTSKGKTEEVIKECKVVLHEIDTTMDTMIDNTIGFLEALKTAHENIETEYGKDFDQGR